MKCHEARPLLSLYFDGELDAPQRAQVQVHLRACPACAARLDDYAHLGRQIQALPRIPAPAALRAGVMGQVAAGRPALGRGARLNRLGSTAIFAAALLLLAFGLASLLRGFQQDEGPLVLLVSPASGASSVSVREPLRITFDRPMDQDSVIAALELSPRVELAFAWQDATLTAVPPDGWSPATAYTLTIGLGARDESGRELD